MRDLLDRLSSAFARTHGTGPLAGVRVLDLSRVVAGPFAAMSLGELGAEVLKVERPQAGDDARAWGPPFFEGEGCYYLAINANKLSVELDLESTSGQDVVRFLASEWADVLIENYKDGTLEAWGIDPDRLREKQPRLVTASIRGYPIGDSRPGYDFIIQASSGLMSIAGPPDGAPSRSPIAITDLSAGNFLVSGIIASLFERERSGLGQHVEVSLWESQVAMLTNVGQAHLMTGQNPRRMGNGHPHIEPYGLYTCADGPIVLAATNDRQFSSLVAALGSPPELEVSAFSTNADRVVNRGRLNALLEQAISTRERAELLSQLVAHDVSCGPVRTFDEVFASPEAELAGTVKYLGHTSLRQVPSIRLPWRFSRTASSPRFGAPLLGEHNALLNPDDKEQE